MRTLETIASADDLWMDAVTRVCADPGEIDVAFQPIIDLARGGVAGYEMLARFRGPPEASPDEWFAAAERLGLQPALEGAVLSRTLASRAGLPDNCFVSLNVSPAALLTDEVQAVLSSVETLGATVIEITEQAPVEDYDALGDSVAQLRARGALVAVDDAGAGYASLSHVMRLKPDFVKLDRGLVTDCDRDPAKLAALEMLGTFAGRVDAWVIAEGVEHQGELDALVALGVPLGQGYHLARPGPAMGGVNPGVGSRLAAEELRRRMVGGVSALLERGQVVPAKEPWLQADAAWRGDPRVDAVVVVDAIDRPQGLLRRGDAPGGALRPPLIISVTDEPKQIALRAMTRAPAERFDPLVCCDGRGRYLGMLRIERLVDAIAR